MITGETDADKLQVPPYNPPPYESEAGSKPAAPSSSTPTPPVHPASGKPSPYASIGAPTAPQTAGTTVPTILLPLPASFVAGPNHPHPYMYYELPTGLYVSSILPPDSPHMRCLEEGRHLNKTRFGLLGILAAVFWFPIGIVCCLIDRRVVCKRCGFVIDDGISC